MNRKQRRESEKKVRAAMPATAPLSKPAELSQRGIAHFRAGRYDEAAADMKAAIALNDRVPQLHSNLGAIYETAGRLDEAEAAYRQALALAPDLAKSHHSLGGALEALGNLAEAEACYRKALELSPDFAPARTSLFNLRRRQESTAAAQMHSHITGYWLSLAIFSAAKWGVADLLKDRARGLDELAKLTGTHAVSLRRVLLFLASQGIFAQTPEGLFKQTPLSETLVTGHPEAMRNLATVLGSESYWRMWGTFDETVKTGMPAFAREHGMSFFDYITEQKDRAATFNRQMASDSTEAFAAIRAAFDFSPFKVFVDVGGGQGGFLQNLLLAHPKARGILADLPKALAGGVPLKQSPIADRCQVVAADFFEAVPEGGDAYILKNVLHDWNDADSLKILRNCHRVMGKDARLVVIDMLLRPANLPDPGRWSDIEMMMLLGGQERSEADFRVLLEEAGFAIAKIAPTGDRGLNVSVIAAKPA